MAQKTIGISLHHEDLPPLPRSCSHLIATLSPTHLWNTVKKLSIFKGQDSDGPVPDKCSEEYLVSRVRLERTTLALKGRCSTN